MSYLNSPATKMIATNCVSCGRALIDAKSVEIGMGPECRKEMDSDIDDDVRIAANKHVFNAAVSAQAGHIEKVLEYADLIDGLGLKVLASKVRRRFKNLKNNRMKTDITIEVVGRMLRVKTPYRRAKSEAFIEAWRSIPGRRFYERANYIPISQKERLWEILREFFPCKVGQGPKGVFRVPKPEPKLIQPEIILEQPVTSWQQNQLEWVFA